jgi:hypothetical protein
VAQVLAGVGDHPEPVGGRVEVDAEAGAAEGDGELADLGGAGVAGPEGVDAAGVADAVQLGVLDAVVDPDQGLVTGQVLDLADVPGPLGGVGVEPDQPAVGGQPDHLQAPAVVAARALVGAVQVAELTAVGDRGDREHAHGAQQQQPPSECLAHRMRLPCLVGPDHRGPGQPADPCRGGRRR